MELQLSDGTKIVDPTPEQIGNAVRSLRSGGDSHVILAESEMTYVQASGPDGQGLFDIEHQLGSLEHHYRALEPAGSEELTIALQSFAERDETWKQAFQWERMDMENTAGGGCLGVVVVAAFGTLAGVAILL
jgi:hypothetical protein